MRRAGAEQHDEIACLIEGARNRYLDFGVEDLPAVLADSLFLIAEDEGRRRGCIGVTRRVRSAALPATAPEYVHLRCIALAKGYYPTSGMAELLVALRSFLPVTICSLRMVIYGGEPWLKRAVRSAEFEIVDRLLFFRNDRPASFDFSQFAGNSPASVRAARHDDLEALAKLDADSFDPLWHYGLHELDDLFFSGQLRVAEQEGDLVGYSALQCNLAEVQLVRLAVHPQRQGHGLGRHLLADALAEAQRCGAETLVLNTQVSNVRSQALYRSFRFRSFGQSIPVLVGELPATRA